MANAQASGFDDSRSEMRNSRRAERSTLEISPASLLAFLPASEKRRCVSLASARDNRVDSRSADEGARNPTE